ncbi:unnamed protein product [Dibothriocephalus latus]|uniref:Tropomyosin n=1 Tax=Dibothriocephalus latus TaxID=60516 RepID=A0A3P7NZI1_DIBLA|nr:unnamed protein product [Dibothriocephalus latus]
MAATTAESLLDTLKKKLLTFKNSVDSLSAELEKKNKILEAEREKKTKVMIKHMFCSNCRFPHFLLQGEVAALQRRIRLLEDELESTDTRLTDATVKLEEASKAADESERFRRALQSRQVSDDDRIEQLTVMIQRTTKEAAEAKAKFEEVKGESIFLSVAILTLSDCGGNRGCKVLENRTVADEERISQLEEQLKEFTFMAEDADRKYDEASRKLAITEVDLERAESRLEASESRIRSMEDELRSVTTNLKSMELSESTVRPTHIVIFAFSTFPGFHKK